jgi:hypothetical protein
MHKPDSLSSVIVDRSHVLTLLSVLKERSIEQVVAGRASAVRMADRIDGKNFWVNGI